MDSAEIVPVSVKDKESINVATQLDTRSVVAAHDEEYK